MDDGLFDRDAHEIEVTDTDKSVASNIKIFLDALKEEFDILAAHMLAATEIFAYQAIIFSRNMEIRVQWVQSKIAKMIDLQFHYQ